MTPDINIDHLRTHWPAVRLWHERILQTYGGPMSHAYFQNSLHTLADKLAHEGATDANVDELKRLADALQVLPNWLAVDKAVTILNEAIEADPDAMDAMLRLRIRCNKILAEHPTIQCFASLDRDEEAYEYAVSPFGLINGLFGTDERSWGHLSYTTDEDGRVCEVSRMKAD